MFLYLILIFALLLSGCNLSYSDRVSTAEAKLEDIFNEDIEILYEPFEVTNDYFSLEARSLSNPDIVFKVCVNADNDGLGCTYVDSLMADKLTKRQMEHYDENNYYIYNFVPFPLYNLTDTSMSLEEYCSKIDCVDFTTYFFYAPDDNITDVNKLYTDLQDLYSNLPTIESSAVQLYLVPSDSSSVTSFVDDYRKEHYTIDFYDCANYTSYYYVDTFKYENNILSASKDEFIESLDKFYNSNSNSENYIFRY